MSNPKVKPLPTERRPVPQPVDRIYGPPEEGATPHKVSAGEDWYSLAVTFMIHETKLMDYNFKTINPGEVIGTCGSTLAAGCTTLVA